MHLCVSRFLGILIALMLLFSGCAAKKVDDTQIGETKLGAKPEQIETVLEKIRSVTAEEITIADNWLNVDAESVAAALRNAVNNTISAETASTLGFEEGTINSNHWSLALYHEGAEWSSQDLHFSLSCGLPKNIVHIELASSDYHESVLGQDEALYMLVRHSMDYPETIDKNAYEHVKDELITKMTSTVEQMHGNPLEATGYELTLFDMILNYTANEKDSLTLYRYRYAITVAHPECDGWAGGMYLDSKLRVQNDYLWAGYVALLEHDGTVVETIWYDSDYYFSDESLDADASDHDTQFHRWAERTLNETPMGD